MAHPPTTSEATSNQLNVHRRILKLVFVGASLLLYVFALFLTSYDYGGERQDGLRCLVLGAFTGVFIRDDLNPFPLVSWLSNLPFAIGLIVLLFSSQHHGFRVAYKFLLVSSFMSAGALICYHMPNATDFSPAIGCFVWIMSQLILLTGAGVLKKNHKTDKAARV